MLISNCFLKINELDQAKLFFDKSDTSVIDDYDLIAEYYFLKGDNDYAKKIISSNPVNNKDPRYLLISSKIMIREGNLNDAENIVKEAIEISKEQKIPFIFKKVKNYLMRLKVTNPIKFNNHIFLRNKSFKFCS